LEDFLDSKARICVCRGHLQICIAWQCRRLTKELYMLCGKASLKACMPLDDRQSYIEHAETRRQVDFEKKSWPRDVGEGGSSVDGGRVLQLARCFKISDSRFIASMETFCSTSTHVSKLTHSTTGHTLPELLGRSVLALNLLRRTPASVLTLLRAT